mmetsp:Transcript_33354/g.92204  ORF Transcript_33354/g.92204 Transcript_33354/m.92204 type:complete len:211 (-) Transcript_33354:1430-2062(-)
MPACPDNGNDCSPLAGTRPRGDCVCNGDDGDEGCNAHVFRFAGISFVAKGGDDRASLCPHDPASRGDDGTTGLHDKCSKQDKVLGGVAASLGDDGERGNDARVKNLGDRALISDGTTCLGDDGEHLREDMAFVGGDAGTGNDATCCSGDDGESGREDKICRDCGDADGNGGVAWFGDEKHSSRKDEACLDGGDVVFGSDEACLDDDNESF